MKVKGIIIGKLLITINRWVINKTITSAVGHVTDQITQIPHKTQEKHELFKSETENIQISFH